MWIHVPGETQTSVIQALSARKGGKIVVVKFERDPKETSTRSHQIFFSHVSKHVNTQRCFNDAIFLMTGVDMVILDEYDELVGDGKWDLYAQLDENCFTIHYWAVHSATGNHVAYMHIPKFSNFIHFSPCGHKFVTMDIGGKDEEMNKCKVIASFYTTDIIGKHQLDTCHVVSP